MAANKAISRGGRLVTRTCLFTAILVIISSVRGSAALAPCHQLLPQKPPAFFESTSDDTTEIRRKPLPSDFLVLGFLRPFNRVQQEKAVGADGSLALRAVQTNLLVERFDGLGLAAAAALVLQRRPDAVGDCCHEIVGGSQGSARFRVQVGPLPNDDTRGRASIPDTSVVVEAIGDSDCNGKLDAHGELLTLSVEVVCVRDEDGNIRCESMGTLRVEEIRVRDGVPTTSVRIERSYRRSDNRPRGLEVAEVDPVRIHSLRSVNPTHVKDFALSAVIGATGVEVRSKGGPEVIKPSPPTSAVFLFDTEHLILLDLDDHLTGILAKVN